MLYLELYNKLNACFKQFWDIDFEHQAEQLIRDTLHTTGTNAVRWILRDRKTMSMRVKWTRPNDSVEMPTIKERY
jgi:hypothetical protein